MVSANKIREQLVSYLANGIDLDSFEDWVAQSTWNISRSRDLESRQLTFAVELRLSEHSSGHLLEQNLRDELAMLLVSHTAKISDQAIIVDSGASDLTVPAHVSFQWQPVDTLA